MYIKTMINCYISLARSIWVSLANKTMNCEIKTGSLFLNALFSFKIFNGFRQWLISVG